MKKLCLISLVIVLVIALVGGLSLTSCGPEEVVELEPEPWIAEPSNGTWVSGLLEIAAIEYNFREITEAIFEYSQNTLNWSLIGVDTNGTDEWVPEWNGTYTVVWNTSGVDEGWYYLRATMHDAFGHFGQSNIQVYVDPTPPVPYIIQPLDNSTVGYDPTQLEATTYDEDVCGIVFLYYNVSDPYDKPLTALSQPDDITCVPTAAASSLLWLDKKYDDNLVPNGMENDPSKLIKDLTDKMGTRKKGFTTPRMAQKGLFDYLKEYEDRMKKEGKEPVKFKWFYQDGVEGGKQLPPPKGGWFSFFKKYVQHENLLVGFALENPEGKREGHCVVGKSFNQSAVVVKGGKKYYGVDFMDPRMGKDVQGNIVGGEVYGFMDEDGNIIDLRREDGELKYREGVEVFISDIFVLSPEKVVEELYGAKDPYGWTVIGNDTDGQDGWTVMWDTAGLPRGPYLLLAVMVDSVGNVASDVIWVELVLE